MKPLIRRIVIGAVIVEVAALVLFAPASFLLNRLVTHVGASRVVKYDCPMFGLSSEFSIVRDPTTDELRFVIETSNKPFPIVMLLLKPAKATYDANGKVYELRDDGTGKFVLDLPLETLLGVSESRVPIVGLIGCFARSGFAVNGTLHVEDAVGRFFTVTTHRRLR